MKHYIVIEVEATSASGALKVGEDLLRGGVGYTDGQEGKIRIACGGQTDPCAAVAKMGHAVDPLDPARRAVLRAAFGWWEGAREHDLNIRGLVDLGVAIRDFEKEKEAFR